MLFTPQTVRGTARLEVTISLCSGLNRVVPVATLTPSRFARTALQKKAPTRFLTIRCSSGGGTPVPASSTWKNSLPLLLCRVELARQLMAGVSMLFFTSKVFSMFHGCCATAACHTTMQVAGAVHLTIGSAVVHVITDAMTHDRLHSETYQRLLFGMAAVLLAALTMLRSNATVLSGLSSSYLPNVAVGMSFVCVVAQQAGLGVGAAVQRAFELTGKAVASILKCPNLVSFFYILTTLATAVGSGVMLTQPQAVPQWTMMSPGGPLGNFLTQQCGVCFLMTTAVMVTLKDAGDRGRLGASTFVMLNRAVAACGAILAAVFGYSLLKSTSHAAALSKSTMPHWSFVAALLLVSAATASLAAAPKGE